MTKRILLAIPCYNCRNEISLLIKSIVKFSIHEKMTPIIIDNRSTDGTAEAALETIKSLGIQDRIAVLRNKANYGLGGSHKVAFLLAIQENYEYVGILHGDNQALPEEILALISEALQNPHLSAVLGARFMKNSRLVQYSRIRNLGNRLLNIFYSILTKQKVSDLGSGLNLFRVRDLDPAQFCKFADGFTFNMDLLLHYVTRRARLKYIPITWTNDEQVSNARTFQVGWAAMKTALYWFSKRPRHLDRFPTDYTTEKAIL